MTPGAILIFAAGHGTRMGALTRDRPKPLIEVAGRPLLDHALALTERMALRRVVNVHAHAALLRAHLARRDVAISDETDLLRETGGGLRHALPLLGDGPVYTLNSDAVWRGPNPLAVLQAAWDGARMEALLLLLRPADAIGHQGRGDFALDAAGRLTRGGPYVYSGAQITQTGGLAAIGDAVFSLNRLWDGMIGRGTLFGIVHDGRWCDVGRPESLPLAERLLEVTDVR